MTASNKQWLDVLIKSLGTHQLSPLGERLPDFPSDELQRNTTGLSAEAAIRQAFAFYENVQDGLLKARKTLVPESCLLDFGFGWGRISRVFMQDVRSENIHGIDVDPDFVVLTRELFQSEKFEVCPPFPPTDYPEGKFDLIYAYSVFSHLSEKACRAWMSEFERILKPGGVVAFTTRHISFFDFCEWAAKQGSDNSYISALGKLFPDLEAARGKYRAGELVHASSEGVGGGGPRDSSFYGETWIPEQYVRTGMGTGLEFISGYFDGSKYDQACFALKKRS
ncbi:MAG: class I SAM-dependent methyltransferase [Pseudoxanthomonas sp.]